MFGFGTTAQQESQNLEALEKERLRQRERWLRLVVLKRTRSHSGATNTVMSERIISSL